MGHQNCYASGMSGHQGGLVQGWELLKTGAELAVRMFDILCSSKFQILHFVFFLCGKRLASMLFLYKVHVHKITYLATLKCMHFCLCASVLKVNNV